MRNNTVIPLFKLIIQAAVSLLVLPIPKNISRLYLSIPEHIPFKPAYPYSTSRILKASAYLSPGMF